MGVVQSSKTEPCKCYNGICSNPPLTEFISDDTGPMQGRHCIECGIYHMRKHIDAMHPKNIAIIRQYLENHPEIALEL